MLFVPLFFVCWINGFCLEGWKKEAKFKTEEECKIFLTEWKGELLMELNNYGRGTPFRLMTGCKAFEDGIVTKKKLPTKINKGKDI